MCQAHAFLFDLTKGTRKGQIFWSGSGKELGVNPSGHQTLHTNPTPSLAHSRLNWAPKSALGSPALPQKCNRTSCPPAPLLQALHGHHSMDLGRAHPFWRGSKHTFLPRGAIPQSPARVAAAAEGGSGSSHTFPTSGSSWTCLGVVPCSRSSRQSHTESKHSP